MRDLAHNVFLKTNGLKIAGNVANAHVVAIYDVHADLANTITYGLEVVHKAVVKLFVDERADAQKQEGIKDNKQMILDRRNRRIKHDGSPILYVHIHGVEQKQPLQMRWETIDCIKYY
jgi:hypothetical protein